MSPRRLPTASSRRLEVGRDLAREPHRERVVAAQVLDAGLGGDGEALGHGQAEPRHLRDVRALAPEEVAHLAPALGEVVHPLGDHTGAAHRAPPTSVTRSKSATRDRTPAASRTSAYRRARTPGSSALTSTSTKKRSTASASGTAAASAASNPPRSRAWGRSPHWGFRVPAGPCSSRRR